MANLRRCKYPFCNRLTKSRYCELHSEHEDKKRRYCTAPGCNNLISLSDWYCEEHKNYKQKRYDSKRESSTKRGYGSQWRKVRAEYVKQHPICELCEKIGITKEVAVVHHKIPVKDGGAWFDFDNLQSLCAECHNRQDGHARMKGKRK